MLTPGFIAAHSHRLEDLTTVAVNLMAKYPLAPLEQDVLLVQSNGIAQWLKIALAQHNGVASMLEVTLPARFIWRAYRAVLGDDIPRHSPYDKQRLRWRIMRILPQCFDDTRFASLQRYVADDKDQRKLFQLSDKLADLFDQYQVYRAEWLDAWLQGDDVVYQAGQPRAVEDEHLWQPELWRSLSRDIGEEDICSNRAALHQAFLQRASQLTDRPHEIPPRVLVFGISSLPRQSLEVLYALKRVSQVVLCVHNPCQYHWADIIDGREFFRAAQRQRLPNKDVSLVDMDMTEQHLHAHPLLASWGKQGRDYIRLLDEFDETREHQRNFSDLRFDLFDEQQPTSLLQQLQSDILHLRPVHETQQMWQQRVSASDYSVCFHRCHSPQREVEVLHDQLLAAFSQDPSLQPKDVMVMMPDVDQYAPYIKAVFGRLPRHDKRYIPFTIADQGQRHRHPMLIALETLLAAPQQRFTHSDLFDLLHVPAIQQRFGLDEQDVEQLQSWTTEAGARWGLDAQHRQALGLSTTFEENSWLFALKRMLYGYAAGDVCGEPWQGIEPYAEVAGIQAKAAGGLSLFLEHLQQYWQVLSEARSMTAWYSLLQQLLDDFFAPSDDNDQLLLNRLLEALDSLMDSIHEADFTGDIRYNIVQEAWLSQIDEGGLNQRFLAGSVNFATLMPMRAIPFRCVCLLGMQDGDYPRSHQKTDFDLMQGNYQPGDRSRREDDRYLFLEALLSARETLYVSWVGMSAQDNTDLPPSVLVGQLQDHIRSGWQGREDNDVLERLTTRHRLQPFAQDYYQRHKPQPGKHFTYAKEWLSVHHTTEAVAATEIAQLEPYQAEAPFSLYDVQWLLREPAQIFTTQRLGVRLSDMSTEYVDIETFNLDGLGRWQVKQEMVAQIMAQRPDSESGCAYLLRDTFARIGRRGNLPLSHQAKVIETELSERMLAMHRYLRTYWGADFLSFAEQSAEVCLGPFALRTELKDLYYHRDEPGTVTQLQVKVSKVAHITSRSQYVIIKHALESWLRHLVLSVHLPDKTVYTQLLGDGQRVTLPPLSLQQAQQRLTQLGEMLSFALCQPLPTALDLATEWFSKGDKFDLANAFAEVSEKLGYLTRFYPSSESLRSAGFAEVSESLYGLMMEDLSGAQLRAFD